jgi:hypothetical protein
MAPRRSLSQDSAFPLILYLEISLTGRLGYPFHFITSADGITFNVVVGC